MQAVFMERPVWDIFHSKDDARSSVHRVEYVAPMAGGGESRYSGSEDRNNRPEDPEEVREDEEVIVAPSSIPTTLPNLPKDTATRGGAGGPTSGPLVGGKGNTRGVQPRYTDPRLWPSPEKDVADAAAKAPPKTPAQQLDSLIKEALGRHNDSVEVAKANTKEPGDWTFEKDGQKYGIDKKFIRLGPVAIPTAILALLPLNRSANPATTERDRRNASMGAEIQAQAQRRINDADFQKAVRAIRERKERERKEAQEEEDRQKK